MTADEETLDEAALARLDRIGGGAFVVEMIDLFLENAPGRVEAARTAFDAGDLPGVYRAVHSLKSTAANLGARALQATATVAEARAKDEAEDALRPLLADLERQYREARAALELQRDLRTGARGPTEEPK